MRAVCLILAAMLSGCPSSGSDDCREQSEACASGFACREGDAGWQCVEAADAAEGAVDATAADAAAGDTGSGDAAIDAGAVDEGLNDATAADGAVPSTIGAACEATADCAPGERCWFEEDGYPGGLCAREGCGAESACPVGSICAALDERAACVAACDPDCRDGYTCRGGACLPDPCVVGAEEICDGLDNDCDGRFDEGASVQCGGGDLTREGRCVAGACTLACRFGQLDLDGVAANGCEASGVRHGITGTFEWAYVNELVEEQFVVAGDPFELVLTLEPGRSHDAEEPAEFRRGDRGIGVDGTFGDNALILGSLDGVSGRVALVPGQIPGTTRLDVATYQFAENFNGSFWLELAFVSDIVPIGTPGELPTRIPAVSLLSSATLEMLFFDNLLANGPVEDIWLADYERIPCASEGVDAGLCIQREACRAGPALQGTCAGPDFIVCCDQGVGD